MPLFFFLFLLSGATGLVYESLWTHYLRLFLGHAAFAQTLVLMLFMGGMAIGAWLTSRREHQNPLQLYAIVEGLIGVIALIFHLVFTRVTDLAFMEIFPAANEPILIEALKWMIAALFVVPGSILLGATFPLMVTGLLRRYQMEAGRLVASLYFVNSLGAAIGVLICGFWLIARFGLPGSMLIAGAINILLAIVVYLLSRRPITQVVTSPASPGELSPGGLLVLVALMTGLASFVYEIAWIRMLSLVLGSSTHAFELMLSAFVLGLALGGYWVRHRIVTLTQPIVFLGKVQLIMGVMALLSMLVYEQSFHWMQMTMAALAKSDAGYVAFNVISHGIALLVMLPTTFCAGMTLPIITERLVKSSQGESAVGRVYAANTVGAILGVVISVHLLMPFVGLQNLLAIGAAIDMGLGLVLFYYGRWPYIRAAGVVALLLGVLIYSQVDFAVERLASGVFRDGVIARKVDPVFHADGKTATVDVYDVNDTRLIATNGKSDASVGLEGNVSPDEYTMTLLAAIPMLMKPDAADIAVIGMGSGITTHTLLTSPRVKRVDTVEIEPAMVAGARFFDERSQRAFTDSRSNIAIDDARTYFTKHDARYDLIVSEPSNPWVSGVSSVFSREFYRQVTRYLEPDGLFVQWLHLYESNEALVFSVLNALEGQFAHYDIYFAVDGDVIIIASVDAPLPRLVDAIPVALGDELGRLGISSVDDIRVRYLVSRSHITTISSLYPTVNMDYFPFLDLHSTKARFKGEQSNLLVDIRTSLLPIGEVVIGDFASRTPLNLTETGIVPNPLVSLARQAKVLSTAITDPGNHASLTDFDRRLLFDLLSIRLACENRIDIALWEESLMGFAGTLLFLSPGELRPVWEILSDHQCGDSESLQAKRWLMLLDALSRRDMGELAALSETLLQGRRSDSSTARFLKTVQAMVLTAEGHFAKAIDFIHENELVDDNAHIATKLMYLHALSEDARSNPD